MGVFHSTVSDCVLASTEEIAGAGQKGSPIASRSLVPPSLSAGSDISSPGTHPVS